MMQALKTLFAGALLAGGILLAGCTPGTEAGPSNNGGAEVSEDTKSRLQTASDGRGQEEGSSTSDNPQSATPPPGE